MTYKAHAQGSATRPRGPAQGARGARKAGTPRFLQQAVARPLAGGPLTLGRPGDAFEREADRMSERVRQGPADAAGQAAASPTATLRPAAPPAVAALQGSGRPLDAATRGAMEPRFGADLGHVRLHSGSEAAALNRDLGSRAFTLGSDIFFGAGHGPHDHALMAHELTHAIQQGGGAAGQGISARSGPPAIQRDLMSSMSVPLGGFEIGMQALNGSANTPPTFSGLSGTIRFIPDVNAPNSNSITLVQIVRLTDLGGTDVDPQSMGAPQAPRGALGDPGVRTQDDAARGVEGGFFTDVLHKPLAAGATPAAPGSALSPNYPFQPVGVGTAGTQTPGFKRSSDPADMRSAVLFDAPGATGTGANFDFTFETVARSEDTGTVYGALHWGFQLNAGVVQGEHVNAVAGQSATFDEALERHRDFYVHEPVSFYFDFDSDVLNPGEAAKIDAFLPYMGRNPTVHVALEGFADQVGGASRYNADLSLRRATSVEAGLLARGIPAARIDGIIIGHGASTAATTDAGTGDQGGNPVVGADQSREANRQMNRRVLLTFTDTAPPAPATPAPAPAPAGP
jgi:outer membrane protein OmpA-like peptidoglycan-associated protein